jgi:hypothetical protein
MQTPCLFPVAHWEESSHRSPTKSAFAWSRRAFAAGSQLVKVEPSRWQVKPGRSQLRPTVHGLKHAPDFMSQVLPRGHNLWSVTAPFKQLLEQMPSGTSLSCQQYPPWSQSVSATHFAPILFATAAPPDPPAPPKPGNFPLIAPPSFAPLVLPGVTQLPSIRSQYVPAAHWLLAVQRLGSIPPPQFSATSAANSVPMTRLGFILVSFKGGNP